MIVVQITNLSGAEVSVPKIKKLVKYICNHFRLQNATVSIVIVDNTQIRRINSQFLKRRSITDCLSFDLSDPATPKATPEASDQNFRSGKLFELIVNGELALKEANSRGHSCEAELALYITHGLMHNLGFDDSTPNQAKKMHNTEDEILKQLGYGSVYNKSD
jgi:probable rRNA maturation factor